jgi:hypothetical protein
MSEKEKNVEEVKIGSESKKKDELFAKRSIAAKKAAETRKKKAGTTPQKTNKQQELMTNIQTLLLITSTMAGSKAGEHWIISEDESKQIAEPLSKILDDMGYCAEIMKYSNHVALLTALITIIAPRIIIQSQQKKIGGVKSEEKTIRNDNTITKSSTNSYSSENIKTAIDTEINNDPII